MESVENFRWHSYLTAVALRLCEKSVEMKSLKLSLVQKIMATNDPEVLETIRQILEVAEPAPSTSSSELPKTDPVAHALGLQGSETNLDADSNDLQQSIDDIFNPKG